MRATLSIRTAGATDLNHTLSLYAHLNPGEAFPSDAEQTAIWSRIQSTAGLSVLLGEVDGRTVTTCTLIVTPNLTRGGRPYAHIENVVTHPEFRNRGFGQSILKEAITQARAANCYKVVLTTGSKRESTLAFYEKAGFIRNSRTAFEVRL